MSTYSEAVKMTPEELRDHPEVELCACAHPRGLHTYGRESLHQCKGRYVPGAPGRPLDGSCDCTEFGATGLRAKNSLVSLPIPQSRTNQESTDAAALNRLYLAVTGASLPEFSTNAEIYDEIRVRFEELEVELKVRGE